MANNIDKERWIEDVMNSTAGMNRAQPDHDLYEKVSAKLRNQPANTVRSIAVRQWAAAAVILLALNIGSVAYIKHQSKLRDNNTSNPIAMQMQLESTYNY
jgi:hypothetical protein